MKNQNQASNLEILFGKFTGKRIRKNSIRHNSRIKKLVNKIRDCYVLISHLKSDKNYLMDQISQRDLMIDDCHETMLGASDIIKGLELRLIEVAKERDTYKEHLKFEVVA